MPPSTARVPPAIPPAAGTGATGATGRRRRTDGELTWRRVLDSAAACILELGYYQASSNEIARRAGVTWGVIQHQFGTREGLLLAVLNDRWATIEHRMATADVHGETLEERLECVLEVLESHYGKPEHLVQLQIILDLSKNPKTSRETRLAVAAHGEELTRAWQPLFDSALGPAAQDLDLVKYAFLTLRGYLQGGLISSRIADTMDDTVQRRLLVRGIALAIRERAQAQGMALD
jgi:AcrR family transcriptional regulator